MIFWITLSLLLSNILGACQYNTLFKEIISETGSPDGHVSFPFTLILADQKLVPTLVGTEQKCIDFCNSKSWCMGVSDLRNTPQSASFCQLITSWQAIGFPTDQSLCTKEKNTLNCALKSNTLISIDNNVFVAASIDIQSGGQPTEHIIPSNIIERTTAPGDFCHILKSDNEIFNTESDVFSDYFGSSPVVFRGIINFADGSRHPSSRGEPNEFARRGTSLAHNGFPIVGMEVTNSIPYDTATKEESYRIYRTKFRENTTCFVSESVTLISPEERKDRDSFFTISATRDDGTDKRYLSCETTTDDNHFACTWKAQPDMVWRMGAWDIENGHDSRFHDHGSKNGGFDRAIIAYDINNLNNELGWLDISNCDNVNKNNADQIRLLHGGKVGSKLHCGVNNWAFKRGKEATYDFYKLGGTMIEWHIRKKHSALANPDNLDTFVREAINIAEGDNNARSCGEILGSGTGFNCNGENGERARKMLFEPYLPSEDTNTLFSIESNGNHLHCPRDGGNCFWAAPNEHKKHYFKFYSYGIGRSLVTPMNDAELSNTNAANNNIIVYEKVGSFMVAISYLSASENNGDGTFHLFGSEMVDNKLRDGTTNGFNDLLLDNVNAITTLFGDNKLFTGELNNDAKFGPITDATPAATLVSMSDAVLNSGRYHWIIDAHESQVNHTNMCPDGEYLHQIHCKFDTNCERVDIACVKPTTNCAIDVNSNITFVGLNQTKFSDCPKGHVVVGFNATHIACQELDITYTPPVNHVPTSFSSIGFLTEPTFIASKNSELKQETLSKFNGKPFQAIQTSTTEDSTSNDKVPLWSYGNECIVNAQNSNFNIFKDDAQKKATQRNIRISCDTSKSEFISHVFCNDRSNNCFNGIAFYCDAAPKCKMTGQTITKEQNARHVPVVCPFGTVMTGITCTEPSNSDPDKELGPCAQVKIDCSVITIDPNFNPEIPSGDDDGDDKSTTRAILIGLGVGLPLVVIGAIACLCLLPDETILSTNDVPVSESARVRDYEMIHHDDVERTGIRRRRF